MFCTVGLSLACTADVESFTRDDMRSGSAAALTAGARGQRPGCVWAAERDVCGFLPLCFLCGWFANVEIPVCLVKCGVRYAFLKEKGQYVRFRDS